MARCSKVQGKSDEANAKGNAERKLIRQDLNNVSNDLSDIRYLQIFS